MKLESEKSWNCKLNKFRRWNEISRRTRRKRILKFKNKLFQEKIRKDV
jgi:hypothetical protein